MKQATRKKLIAAVITVLIIVIIVWYMRTRERHYEGPSVTAIAYTPATSGTSASLTYTFSGPLSMDSVAGTSAVLKSFTEDATSTPTNSDVISTLVGGLPFVPETTAGVASQNTLVTHTVPAGLPRVPVTMTGRGVMWFVRSRQ